MSGEGKRFSEGQKNFEKSLKKPLTTTPNSDIINTKRGRTPHKPERVTTMKKNTLIAVFDALKGFGYEDEEVLAEIAKEINKGAEAKAKNAEAYESIHDIVLGALTSAPATVAEIWDAIEDEVPEGITKGKVQYALTHLWGDEIVKVEGKPNGYRKA